VSGVRRARAARLRLGPDMPHDGGMADEEEKRAEEAVTSVRARRARAAEEEPPKDGRVARAVRTRKAVADALLNLIEEGDLRPTSKSIAERAGVSERTIFQHFEDLETLFSAAADRVGDRILTNLKDIPADGPFENRLRLYMDEMTYLHDSMTPVRRASRLHEPFSPVLSGELDWLRLTLRRGLERVFGIELAAWPEGEQRQDVVEALALITSWSSWETMRKYSDLSPERARRIIEHSCRALLGQPAPSPASETAPADESEASD
jgi:TetR/AcrR family transcriptional regulator of autoinduction and epiphytic fitness